MTRQRWVSSYFALPVHWASKRLYAQVFMFCCCLLVILAPASADVFEPGEPPRFPSDVSDLAIFESFEPIGPATTGFSIDPESREASSAFFNTYYRASEGHAIGWTGNHATCDAGQTTQDFRDAVLLRVNYFRAMAGVPSGIVFSDIYNSKAQKAALMMSVNSSLSHNPPPSWTCYTSDGAQAASNSNLFLGVFGWDAITGYVKDFGSGNYAVGHRRWILYPQTQTMGTGDIPYVSNYPPSNDLWVFDSNLFGPRPPTREEFVAWPPPGYVPYQVVFPRWSFSYPWADFSAATVTMNSEGVNLSVKLEAVVDGYGENTLAWIPMNMNASDVWPKPERDTMFSVNISNVLISGSPHSFQYDVVVFDPDVVEDTTPPSVSVTSHSDNQHVATSSITLAGMASDSGKGNNGIQQVTVNGVRANNDTATGSGTANWNSIVALYPGGNTIPVIAYDNSPNHNQTSQTITIYYDAPVIYVSKVAIAGSCSGRSPCFSIIQEGIQWASAPSIIKITEDLYAENIVLGFDQVIVLQGGWDANFTTNSSSTTIQGSITITHGTMILEDIILK